MLRSPEGFLHCLYSKRRNVIIFGKSVRIRQETMRKIYQYFHSGFCMWSLPGKHQRHIPLPCQLEKEMRPWTGGLVPAIPRVGPQLPACSRIPKSGLDIPKPFGLETNQGRLSPLLLNQGRVKTPRKLTKNTGPVSKTCPTIKL